MQWGKKLVCIKILSIKTLILFWEALKDNSGKFSGNLQTIATCCLWQELQKQNRKVRIIIIFVCVSRIYFYFI